MNTSLESSRDASCGAWCRTARSTSCGSRKKGKFPKRIKIGERRVGWWLHEVMAWLDQKSGKGGEPVAT